MRFLLFVWWEMFTTDTTVYPCEQNQNQYENGLNPRGGGGLLLPLLPLLTLNTDQVRVHPE